MPFVMSKVNVPVDAAQEIHYGYEKFAVALTEIFGDVPDIPPQNVYGKLFNGAR